MLDTKTVISQEASELVVGFLWLVLGGCILSVTIPSYITT